MKYLAWICLFIGVFTHAQTTVTWVQDIPKPVASNIAVSLSAFDGFDSCRAVTPLTLVQQRQALGELLLASFHAYGYFAAQFTTLELIDDPEEPNSNCQAWRASVNTGPLATVGKVAIDGDAPLTEHPPLAAIHADLQALTGLAFDQNRYTRLTNQLYSQAIANGYFDLEVGSSKVVVADNNQEVELVLEYRFGQRYAFGEFVLIDNTLDPELLAKIVELPNNTPYSLSKLTQMTTQLRQSGYFAQVNIRPDITKRRDDIIDVLVTLTEKHKHYVDYGVGFATDVGPRASIQWQRPRLNDAGHRMRVEAQVSAPEQDFLFSYKVPLADPNSDYIDYQIGLLHTDHNDNQTLTGSLGVTRFFSVIEDWTNTVFTRISYSDFRQAGEASQTTQLWFVGAGLQYLQSDDVLFPTTAQRHDLTIEAAQDELGSDFSVYRVLGQTKWLRSVTPTLSWLGVWRASWMDTDDFSRTPTELRFYGGGDQSVRGFGYQALAPVDMQGDLLGADSIISTQQELMYALNEQWSVALFADGAYLRLADQEIRATGLGIGGHWRSPVGPVRFYIAHGNSDIEQQWRIHLLLGPLL
jgi:translocation and assembly module TamA